MSEIKPEIKVKIYQVPINTLLSKNYQLNTITSEFCLKDLEDIKRIAEEVFDKFNSFENKHQCCKCCKCELQYNVQCLEVGDTNKYDYYSLIEITNVSAFKDLIIETCDNNNLSIKLTENMPEKFFTKIDKYIKIMIPNK